MKTKNTEPKISSIFLIVAGWFLITELAPFLNRVFDFRSINVWIIPYIRMFLMLLITWLFVHYAENKSFSAGFNINFKKFWKNLLWAVVFFLVAGLLIWLYQQMIVKALTEKTIQASSEIHQPAKIPFPWRLFEYSYIVFEGFVEVLIFIGFLIDRLAKKWDWTAAIFVGNIVFALWHYNYWSSGLISGTLMIILSFIMGMVVSFSYLKTRNSVSPILCHFFIDSPNAIRELLGIV